MYRTVEKSHRREIVQLLKANKQRAAQADVYSGLQCVGFTKLCFRMWVICYPHYPAPSMSQVRIMYRPGVAGAVLETVLSNK